MNNKLPLFRVLVIAAILLSGKISFASHVAGGEIYYRCVADNGTTADYEIVLNVYHDCGGIPFNPNSVLLTLNSTNPPNNLTTSSLGYFRIFPSNNCIGATAPPRPYSFKITNSGTEISSVCPSATTECNGGTIPGIDFYQFTDTITLSKNCNEWKLQYINFARNSSVNLLNASSENILIESTLNTTAAIGSCNASPQFLTEPAPYFCLGDTVTTSYNAIDPDGDSLVFSLVDAERLEFISNQNVTVPMIYNAGYSGTKPINNMVPYDLNSYINPTNGDITFAPNTTGNFVFAVKVFEYNRANGGLKGTIKRDYQIEVSTLGCFTNTAPVAASPGLKNPNSLGSIIDSTAIATVPSNDTLCFEFSFEDADGISDTLQIVSNIQSALGNGASITVTGTNPTTAKICWPLTGVTVGTYPVLLTAKDNNCPVNAQSSVSIKIQVNQDAVPTGFTQIPETCPGTGDGGFTANFSGGLGPFKFEWYISNNGVPGTFALLPNDTNQTLTNAIPGRFYQFKVVDKGTGVTSSASNFIITYVSTSGITITQDTILKPNCRDVCGTEVEIINILGGAVSPDTVTSYKFNWFDASNNSVDTTNHPSNLCPGSYTVRIEDDNGCDTTYSYFLSTPATFEAVFSDSTDVLCRGESTGSLTLSGSEATCGIIENVCAAADLSTDTIETGSLTFNFNAFPSAFPNGSQKTRQQFLYRAAELSAIGMKSGKISAIDFFVSGFPATISSYSIGMTCISSDSLNDWALGINTVYDSKSTSAQNGQWTTLTFDRAFQWDGTSNVVIELCTELAGTSVNVPTRLTTTSYPSSLIYSSDTSDACGQNTKSPSNITIGGTPYTINNFQRPDIIFRYCDVEYTFNWVHNGALTDSIANNLAAGTYQGIVTNQDGCKDTAIATVEQPDSTFRFIFSDSIPLVCFGDTNGQMTVTPLHGQGPYSYNWTPNVIKSVTNDSIAINLRSGVNYSVQVTDNNNCVGNGNISIGERDQIDPTHTILQNIVCAGDTQGVVRINPTNGTGPFTYQWSPAVIFGSGGDSTGINIKGGITYRITVTDGNGCIDSTSFSLPAPLGIVPIQAFEIDQPCFGDTIGVSAIIPTNGLSPYNYTWPSGVIHVDNGDSSRATNLRAGINYKVYVTDANTCLDSITVNVDEPSLLTASFVDSIDALCFGASNGTARMTIGGGTTPYSYNWEHNAGVNDSIANNLPAGRWTVVITDNNGCQAEDSVNIGQPGASMIATINQIEDVSCFGLSDGSIGAQVTGGTRPYNYSWNGAPANQTDSILNNQFAGTYIVSVTDAQGCSFSDTANINQPTQLQVSTVEIIQPSCFGFNNGLIRVIPSGGTKPYTYQWNDPANQTDSIANGLLGSVAGISYKVVLRDSANRCADSLVETITSPFQLLITKADSTNILCFGNSSGSARVIASNGTAPYRYSWNPGGSTDSLIANVNAGNYKVVVLDTNNCSDSVTFNLEQPDSTIYGFFFNVDSVSCNGLTDGSATYAARGGTGPYSYTWSAGTGVGNPTDSITNNLPSGEIRITVTDANACPQYLDTAIIAEPTPIVASIVRTSPAGCSGASNGTATVRASGGFGNFIYEWSAGTGGLNDTTTTGLPAGPISVVVRSVNDTTCKVTLNDIILDNQPIGLVVDSVKDISCNGLSDGFIAVHGTGGYGVYVYSWSHNGAIIDSSASNLFAGSYTINVTDTGGCPSADTTITLSQPLALNLTKVDSSNVSCFGNNDGKARISVSGGTPNYSFVWNTTPFQTTDSATNLLAGIYKVVVTDNNLCSDSIQFNIEQPGASIFTSTTVISNASCFGFSDGAAKISPSGGTTPYSYLWSHNGTLNDSVATGLDSGTYIVQVTDANGCSAGLDTIIITESQTIVATLQIDSNVSCFGLSDGGMSVNVISGGTPPYRYNWSGGIPPLNDSIISGLAVGGYAVTVTDTNGCFIELTDTIVQPTQLVTSLISPPNIPGFQYIGERNGQYVYFSASFLTWDAARQACLNVGGDLIVIKDTSDNNYFSGIFPASSWIGLYQDTLAPTYSEPSGGWFWVDGSPLTFSNWGPGEPNQFFGSANPENHGQFVNSGFWNDIPGTDSYQFGMVINKGGFEYQDASCFGLNDGFASFKAGGGVPPYSYAWSNGDLDSLAENLDSGIYVITITDNNGCSLLDTAIITEPDELIATIADSTDESCVGANDGSARVVWTGGNGNVSFFWSNADVDSIAENLTAGSYGVKVEDFRGCKDSVFVTIGAADTIQLNLTKISDNNCFGETSGQVKGVASGGSGALIYNWSTGTISDDTLASNLSAGFVTLTVTDTNQCQSIDSIEVTQPDQINISFNLDTIPTCLDSNGQITVNVSGGVQFGGLPYQYFWLNQSLDTLNPQPTDSVASGLTAQSYTLVIEDANGCISQQLIPLPSLDGPTISLDTIINAICDDGSTGEIQISVSGNGPFTYLWLPDSATTEDVVGLDSGSYTVQVLDTNSCPSFATYGVSDGNRFGILMAATQVQCFGDSNALASATPFGTAGPYTYSWNKGNVFVPIAPPIPIDSIRQDLPPGFVSVTVTNGFGCSQTDSVFVPEPTQIQSTIISKNSLDCFGDVDAVVTSRVTGGTSPYFFTWSIGPAIPVLHDSTNTNLSAGTYFVTITDTLGCFILDTIDVTQPDSISLIPTGFSDISCFGAGDGMFSVQATGGTTPLFYSWSAGNGGFFDTISQFVDTTFISVTVTDANGCPQKVISQNLNEPNPITVNLVKDDVRCYNEANGSVTAIPQGGNGGYIYTWSAGTGGLSDSITSNLDTGKVVLSVTDILGCTPAIDSVFIIQPDTFIANITKADITCYGLTDGSASALYSGGNGNVSFLWNDPLAQTDSTAINLVADTFEVTITDSRGCIATAQTVINEPDTLVIQFSNQLNPTCFGFIDGEVTANVSGGVEPYIYSWSAGLAGNSDSVNTGLANGTVFLTIRDSNECVAFRSVQIIEPLELIANFTIDSLPLCGQNNGGITAQVSGGTPFSGTPYNLQWLDDTKSPLLPNQTDSIAINLAQGFYYLAITDSNGCVDTSFQGLNALDGPVAYIDSIFDPTCVGFTDGAIYVSDSSGTGPLSYSWNPGGATTQDLVGVGQGIYTLTITDSLGCQAFESRSLFDPIPISIAFTDTISESCFGSDGSIRAIVSGGNDPYIFTWSNGQIGLNDTIANNLNYGVVSLTVTDSVGCIGIDSALIDSIPSLTAFFSDSIGATCFGGANGAATISVSGGVEPYTYSWSSGTGGINDSTTTGLTAGIVSVTISDALGCPPISISQTIGEGAQYQNSVDTILANCGANNGALIANLSGGTPPYSILWLDASKSSLSNTNDSLIGIAAGTYYLSVSDSFGCVDTVQSNLNSIGGPIVSINSISNATANGLCNGAIDVNVTPSGAPIVSYNWLPGGDTTQDISNKCAGGYTLTVTDAAGCITIFTDTITEPPIGPALTVSSGFNSTNCDTNICSGRVFTNPTSGTAPFSYAWSTGVNDTLFEVTNLCAGTYFVTVSDSVGNSIIDTVIIPVRDFIQNISANAIDVTCFGDSNGSIALSTVGGVMPYNYQWSHNGALNTDSVFGLSADSFFVTVTENGGCSKLDTIVVNEPTQVTTNIFATNPVCGASNGVLTAFPTGGTPPYFGNWLDGNKASLGIPPTTFIINTLTPGIYYLVLNDTLGCGGDTIPAAVSNSNGPTVVLVSKSNTSFPGVCDGSLDMAINPFGTTPIDSILWSPTGDTTEDINNLCAGVYTLEVTDSNRCKAFYIDTIVDPPGASPLAISFVVDSTDCNPSNCTGTISANVLGGYTPYTYTWSTNSIPTLMDSISGLCEAMYYVTVTDSVGANLVDSVYVPTIQSISNVSVSTTIPSCSNSFDGQILVQATGGTQPYNFQWSHNLALNDSLATNLQGGNYSVTITEAGGCSIVEMINLGTPPAISILFDTTLANCAQNDGEIVAIVSGGKPIAGVGYNYQWLDNNQLPFTPIQISDTLSNIPAGVYFLEVMDSTCTDTFQVTLNNKNGPQVSLDLKTNPTCFGGSDGSIQITTTGGNLPYTYLWTPGNFGTEDIFALDAGIYTLQVTDLNNCIGFFTDTIEDPAQIITSTVKIADVVCFGDNNGQAEVNIVSGGFGNFSYLWTSGSTSANANNLMAGKNFVTVTDQNLCSTIDSILITQPNQLLLDSVSTVEPSCMMTNGSLTAHVSGGTTPYSYLWQGIPGGQTLSFVGAGIFYLQVTDSNNCVVSTTVGLSNNQGPTFNLNAAKTNCFGSCDGELYLSNISGTGPFSINWPSLSSSSDTIIGVCSGVYGVEVTDVNNCITTDTISVVEPNQIVGAPTVFNFPTCGNSNGKVIVQNISGGTPKTNGYEYAWLDASKDTILPLNITDSLVNAASGIYFFRVSDSLGCTEDIQVNLPNSGAPTINLVSLNDASCVGTATGSIDLSIAGGVAPINYLWLPDSVTTQDRVNLTAGNYTLQVRDGNSCVNFANFTISNSGSISGTPLVISNQSCFNANDGRATVNMGGATQPLFYQWQNGESTDTAFALSNGTIGVTVTDGVGCQFDTSVTITSPPAIIIDSTVITQPNCGQSNGIIFVAASGGTGSLSYLWSNNQTVPGANNLAAGTYTVTISDQNNCSADFTIPISDIGGPIISKSVNDALCFGSCNGNAKINIVSGTQPISYNWPTIFNLSDTAFGLCAGIYPVEVSDSSGCKTIDTVVVGEPNQITVTFSKILPTCGNSNGSITANINGGTPFNSGYSLLWTDINGNVTTPVTTSLILNNAASGAYNVVVGDSNSCGGTFAVTLPNNVAPSLVLDSIINTSCSGVCDGEIFISANGAGNLSYSWSPGGFATQDISGLCSGSYIVQVTDSANCKAVGNYQVQDDISLIPVINILQPITCASVCDAEATVNVVGGAGTLLYNWSNGEKTKTAITLCPGINYVTVTDAGGCSIVDSVTIQGVNPIVINNANINNPACGVCNGSISISATGGVGALNYVWSNGGGAPTIGNLCAGIYNVSVFDNNGCFIDKNIPLSNSNGATFNLTKENISCNGSADGKISVSNLNGTAPFTVFWPQINQFGNSVSGLTSGNYSVQVTDSAGCITVDSISIIDPLPISATFNTQLATCGSTNGSISANVNGGTVGQNGYLYFWLDQNLDPVLPFQNTATASNLGGGIYNLRVTDSLGCQAVLPVSLSNSDGPSIIIESINHASCDGLCDGSINLRITGNGVKILWNPTGDTLEDISNLCPGTYTVTATDQNGCVSFETIEIFGPSAIKGILTSKTNSSCLNSNDGAIGITVFGGSLPISFNWNGPQAFSATIEDVSNLFPGTYGVVISDNNGCKDSLGSTIFANTELYVQAGNDTLICEGVSPIQLIANISPRNAQNINWIDDFGNVVGNTDTIGLPTRPGRIRYYVSATLNNCLTIDTLVVNTTPFDSVDAGSDRVIIEGETITLGGNPTGPAGSSFAWEPFLDVSDESAANPTATPLATTTYVVTVLGESGCKGVDSVLVTVEPAFEINDGFSPNGDGVNDTWTIPILQDYPLAEVEVYNRWGQLIYKSAVPYIAWDGTFGGNELPVGTYYYAIKLNDGINNDAITGTITIIK